MNGKLSWGQLLRIYTNLPYSVHGLVLALPGTVLLVLAAFGIIGNADLLNVSFFTLITLWGWVKTWPALERLPVISRALENGHILEGELIKKEETTTRINKRWLFKLSFSYTYNGKKYSLRERLLGPLPELNKHLIVVDKDNPQNAVYLASLPPEIKIEAIRHYHPAGGEQAEKAEKDVARIRQTPRHLEVINSVNAKTIRVKHKRRFNPVSWLPLLFIAFLCYLMYSSLSEQPDWQWSALLPLALIVLVFGRYALAPIGYMIIHMDRKAITIDWRPRPLFSRKKTFPVADFTGFYLRHADFLDKDGTHVNYSLQGILHHGAGEVTILDRQDDKEGACFIEQEIKSFYRQEH